MIRSQLPEVSKYIFGTNKVGVKAEKAVQDVAVVRRAMEEGVWFHSSQEYGKQGGTFWILRQAFEEAPGQKPKMIFKIRCDNAEFIKFDVYSALYRLDLERVDIAQLCQATMDKRPIVEDFLNQGPMWETCCELKQRGLVGNFIFETFHSFTQDAVKAVDNDLYDGYIMYYNLFERQANDLLYPRLKEKKCPIIAMRILGGAFAFRDSNHPSAKKLEVLKPLLEKTQSKDWVDLSVRYMLSNPCVMGVVGGTSSIEHFEAYVDAVNHTKPLSADVIEEIEKHHDFPPCGSGKIYLV